MGPVNVQLQVSKRAHPFIVHVDKLRPCLGSTPKSWLRIEQSDAREEQETDNNAEDIRFLEDLQQEEEQLEAIILTDEMQEGLRWDHPSEEISEGRSRRQICRPERLKDYVSSVTFVAGSRQPRE